MRSSSAAVPRAFARPRRAAAVSVTALIVAASLGLASCGGDADGDAAAKAPEPSLVFPPTAYEPATSKGGGPAPAGTVKRIGGRPEGLAVLDGTLGVALRDRGHTFALLDARTLEVQETVPLPADPRHVGTAGGRFLVPLEKSDQLAEVPVGGGEPRLTKVGRQPHAVAAQGSTVYVADELADTLTAVRGGKVVGTATVDVQPGGVVDVGGGQVAVISVRANTISLVDTRTLESGPSQNAGYGPSHAVATPDGRVLVADTRGGAILAYETRPRLKFIQRLVLGGSPYGIAIDAGRNRLWVADSGADRLDEISTEGELRKVGSRPTVRQPNTVAVDTRDGTVFVASQATGDLQRIAP